MVGVIDGKIYVAGGYKYVYGVWTVFDTLQIYDIASETWSIGTSMPGPRVRGVAEVFNGKLYVAGGNSSGTGVGLDTLVIYDPTTKSWSFGPKMPGVHDGAVAGAIDGKWYLVGGDSNRIDIYNPSTDSWSQSSLILNSLAYPAVAGVINGKLYATGSDYMHFQDVLNLFVYDPSKDIWTTSSHGTSLRFPTAGVINGKLYVAGGITHDTGNATNETQYYDPVNDSWTKVEPLPSSDFFYLEDKSVVVDGKLYVIGGLNTLKIYTPGVIGPTPTSTPVPPTPTPTVEMVTISGSITMLNHPSVPILNLMIAAVDQSGKRFTTISDNNRNYSLSVPKGETYRLTIEYPSGFIGKFSESLANNEALYHPSFVLKADKNMTVPAQVLPCKSPWTGLDICALQKGDIILTDKPGTINDTIANLFGSYWLHAALVGNDANIIEAQGDTNPLGIGTNDLDVIVHGAVYSAVYSDLEVTNFVVLRPKAHQYVNAAVQKAMEWATNPSVTYVKDQSRLLGDTTLKQQRTQFYCSMLPWAAYYDVSGGALDLDSDGGILRLEDVTNSTWLDKARRQVFPDDLFASVFSGNTYDGRHYAATTDVVLTKHLDAEMIKAIVFSPVDMLLTDAKGRRVGYDSVTHTLVNEIPGAYYTGPDSEPETINLLSDAAPYKIILTGTGAGNATFGFQSMTASGSISADAIQVNSVATGTTYAYNVNQVNGTPVLEPTVSSNATHLIYLPLVNK